MSTSAQIAANRANAESSTGPRTQEGKAASSLNHVIHGLAGEFRVLPTEFQSEYDALLAAFREEHQPATPTETSLVEGMAQHQWLRQRALKLESSCFDPTTGQIADAKQLALCLRYQSTHERGFHKCLNALLKLRAEKRKAEIGFESQERSQAEQIRKQEKHDMAKERHKWDLCLVEAKIDHQRRFSAQPDLCPSKAASSQR